VLGHPAFVASENGGDAKGEAFFTEEGVATVTAAVAHDEAVFGEVGDEGVVGVAGPGHVGAPVERVADGVEAFDEEAAVAEHFKYATSDAGHDAHVDHDVRGVGDFHADAGNFRTDRSHAEGDHIHSAPVHAAAVEGGHFFLHDSRVLPVVGGSGVGLGSAADEGAPLYSGDVTGVRADEEAVGALVLVEADGGAGIDHELAQPTVLLFGAVAPDDMVRLAEIPDFPDPSEQVLVASGRERGIHHDGFCVPRGV
jgi:hypothetical protein